MSTVAHDRPTATTPLDPALDPPALPEQRAVDVAAAATAAGDPMMVGLPTFILGSVALGLTLTGYVPAAAQAGALPVVLAATGLGMVFSTAWAARLGQSAVASVFGIFAGFWLSYGLLLLGLGHNWYGVVAADVQDTVSAFLLTWVIGVTLLTLVTLRLPLAFTVLFALVDLALVLVLLGNERTSSGLTHAGGWVVFLFAALGAYLFAGAASTATGGAALPLGNPVVR